MKITKKYIAVGLIVTLAYGCSALKHGGVKKALKVVTSIAGVFMYFGGLMEW